MSTGDENGGMTPERVTPRPWRLPHLLLICYISALHLAVLGTFTSRLSLGSAEKQARPEVRAGGTGPEHRCHVPPEALSCPEIQEQG